MSSEQCVLPAHLDDKTDPGSAALGGSAREAKLNLH